MNEQHQQKEINMPKKIQTPVSALISLLDEYQLNPYSLARMIRLSPSTVRQVLTGKSKITVPTALRLAKLFGQTAAYWLDLQRDTDLMEAGNDKELLLILGGISKVKKPTAQAKAKPAAKSAKKNSLAGKRKQAAKAPGARPVKRTSK